MFYDLIIVARSSDDYLIQMTQECIDSAGADNVILVETSGKLVDYNGVDIIMQYNEDFNYNRALNMGLAHAKGDVHILANNDLIFHNWRTIGDDMLYNGFDSASAWYDGCPFPQGDYIYPGEYIASHLTGWCIFITQEALRKIDKISEEVEFWYSDNVYALQLKRHGLKHGLFCNSRVDHIGSQTLKTMPIRLKRHYSHGQIPKYRLCERKI